MIATGTSGHASVPLPDNAVVHLAAAIGKIGTHQTPVQPDRRSPSAISSNSSKVEDEDREMDAGARKAGANRARRQAPFGHEPGVEFDDPRHDRADRCCNAGVRANVVPSEARANLNVRLLPGNAIQHGDFAICTSLVNDPKIRFEVERPIRASPRLHLRSTRRTLSHDRAGQRRKVFPEPPLMPSFDRRYGFGASFGSTTCRPMGCFPFR